MQARFAEMRRRAALFLVFLQKNSSGVELNNGKLLAKPIQQNN
jgi:hypothetical protein